LQTEKWLKNVFNEIDNDATINTTNVIYETDNKYIKNNTQKSNIQSYGWVQDIDSNDNNDPDNPPNQHPYDIDSMAWTKNSHGKWQQGATWYKHDNGKYTKLRKLRVIPPSNNNDDIETTFKRIGITIDTMPTPTNDMHIHNLDQTKEACKVNVETGQSDSGANASATSNLSLLEDITWIKPMSVGTASSKDNSLITMQAVG